MDLFRGVRTESMSDSVLSDGIMFLVQEHGVSKIYQLDSTRLDCPQEVAHWMYIVRNSSVGQKFLRFSMRTSVSCRLFNGGSFPNSKSS